MRQEIHCDVCGCSHMYVDTYKTALPSMPGEVLTVENDPLASTRMVGLMMVIILGVFALGLAWIIWR